MRALVQRVLHASVSIEGQVIGRIGPGICVFVAVKCDDVVADAQKLAQKIVKLRIFPDEQGKMNRSLAEVSGELLIISQFTLYADTSRGNRPSYSRAAQPSLARNIYETFIELSRQLCPRVVTGEFQAHMHVSLVNDGPVTLLCASEE